MEDVRHNKCGLTSSSRAALEVYLLSVEGNMAESFHRYIAAKGMNAAELLYDGTMSTKLDVGECGKRCSCENGSSTLSAPAVSNQPKPLYHLSTQF